MLVAMPTAIPVAPFNNKIGSLAGNTTGSRSLPVASTNRAHHTYTGKYAQVTTSMSAHQHYSVQCQSAMHSCTSDQDQANAV
jgi:hypothetical protein